MSPVEPGNSESQRLHVSSPGSADLKSAADLHVSFGLYEFSLRTHELRKGGLRLKIPHQSFQILAMLLERPGQVVSREDLRRKLWPSDVFVNFEASLNSAVQRLRSALQDTSLEPRYIETLPRVGYRFIADVELLTPDSDEQPQTVATLDSAEPPPVDVIPAESSTVLPAHRRKWPYAATVVLSLVVLIVVYVGYRYSRQNPHVPAAQAQPSPVIPSSPVRRSVAVMGFTNVSGKGRDAWLSTAFTEMLATELAAGDHLRTAAAEDVARAKHELSLTERDSYGGNTLTKIHKDLGCDYVVDGSYLAIGQPGGGRVRLDARVQDAVTGDTVASFAVVGSQSDLFDLASRAGEQLRAKLGVGTLTSAEAEEVKLALPSNPEAARLYSDGLARLRVYDDVVASDLFEKVIRLQPEYSPAYSALASAWFALGYDAKAAVAARKAMDLSQGLPQQSRLQTEARYHKINGDWAKAVEIYSHLQRSYPDNLEYGLDLALAQNTMGKSAEAAATIAALQKLPSPQRDDPRLDLIQAGIAGELGDYKREQSLAETAASKADSAGERLLLARAKMIVGYASNDLGDFAKAKDAFAIADRMCANSGDVVGAALAKMDIGISLLQQGDLAGAKLRFEQALYVFRTKGDQASLAAALTNLSEVYGREGDLPKQEHLLRETMAISTRLNRVGKLQIETSNLAECLRRQGKFREAQAALQPLVEHLRSGGNKPLLATALQTLGSIAEDQADIPTALRMYQEAASIFHDAGAKTEAAGAERSLTRAFLRQGDFVSAKQAVSESLSLDREVGAKPDAASGQVELAELALAQPGESIDMTSLRSAIDELRLQKMTDDVIEADIILAQALIQSGKTAEAANILTQTAVLSTKSYNPVVRFDFALATAHLRAAQHRYDDASRTIRPALQSAMTADCIRCQLEARLELGEIELHSGNVKRGRTQLRELAHDAGSRGFRLIADRAAADCQ
jgi:DNA-binding winged helix-turn-helix (wHTH) protein/tetratricopeptide (TPR) repeat protein